MVGYFHKYRRRLLLTWIISCRRFGPALSRAALKLVLRSTNLVRYGETLTIWIVYVAHFFFEYALNFNYQKFSSKWNFILFLSPISSYCVRSGIGKAVGEGKKVFARIMSFSITGYLKSVHRNIIRMIRFLNKVPDMYTVVELINIPY